MDFAIKEHLVRAEDLRSFCADCLIACGLPETSSRIVSESLVYANLRGVDSHGVTRMGVYVERLKLGLVNACPQPRTVHKQGSNALIDGDNGMGQVTGLFALEQAMEIARKWGGAYVGVRNANHYGTGAYYIHEAVQQGFAAFAFSNASPNMPPWGGAEPYIGTNPFAFGVPAGMHKPIIVDMATSVVARGKIILAAQRGEPIPDGWAIDVDGYPTTDAERALEGSMLPIGGHKGYALSLMIDIMAGVLTGTGFGRRVGNLYKYDGKQNVGMFFQLVDISSYMTLVEFTERIDQMIEEIKAVRQAPGVEEILVPGEPEARVEMDRQQHGLPLPAEVYHELLELGRSCGVLTHRLGREEDE